MCLRKRRSAFILPLEESIQPTDDDTAREDFQSPIEGPEAAYSRKELRDLLTQAMAQLRPAYRVVFLLRAVEQLSTSETAKVLQISASAVKARMRRARSELREWLQSTRNARQNQLNAESFASGGVTEEEWLI
jgi:RNA polymerase sigma-70 factor, ECF subfamily